MGIVDGGGGMMNISRADDRNPLGLQIAGDPCWGQPRPSVLGPA